MKIDAVVTWVDGDDEVHARKRQHYLGLESGLHPASYTTSRFSSRGEIGYCIRSIMGFCSFVRNIIVVADRQSPAEIDAIISERPEWRNRLIVADHEEMFAGYLDLLPSFSSRSIETMIHRLPQLSEHFLYFNDDMFIARPLDRGFFFRDGKPVVRGHLRRFPGTFDRMLQFLKRGPQRAGFRQGQIDGARLAGIHDHYVLVEHYPHAMRRSTLARYFADKPDALRRQAAHKFRSAKQVSPIGLANNLELINGAPTEAPVANGLIKPPRSALDRIQMRETLESLRSGNLATLCVQELDAMVDSDRDEVLRALNQHLKEPAQSCP